MLSSLAITNFRNHQDLQLNSLGRINLIAGRNGAGKTSLLEALWILSGPDTPELSGRINNLRGASILFSQDAFRDLFYQFNHEHYIEIKAHGDWGSDPRKLQISLQKRVQDQQIQQKRGMQPEFAVSNVSMTESDDELVFEYTHDDKSKYTARAWLYEQIVSDNSIGPGEITEWGILQQKERIANRPISVLMASAYRENEQRIASRLGELQLRSSDQEVLRLLRPLEPKLKSLISITIGKRSAVHANFDGIGRPIPVRLVGEGFNRMLELALSMEIARGGQLLVDEIENGLHYSVLKDVFSVLSEFAQNSDVQIFATTHSAECIDAAQRALGHKDESEFTVFRLDRANDRTKAVRFDQEMLDTAINHNMEIR